MLWQSSSVWAKRGKYLSLSHLKEEITNGLYRLRPPVEQRYAFPLEDGGFDCVGFTSTEERFHGWCNGLFAHCWEGADPRLEVLDDREKWLPKRQEAISALRKIAEGESEGEHIAELEERGLVR